MNHNSIIILLISILNLSACGQNPEDARKELGQLNIHYSEGRFIEAADNGDLMAVKLFLAAGMNINATENGMFGENITALERAIVRNRIEIFELLLDKGADPNANGGQPLQKAASGGSVEIVKKLLEKGAFSNLGISLIYALKANNLEIAKLLLTQDIDDPNVMWNYQTALDVAVEKNHIEIVQDLLRRGANPNVRAQYSQESALMVAAKNGNKDIIDALLKSGANVNENNGNSISALWYAVRNKHSDAVKALLAAGADPNLVNKEGKASGVFLSMAIKEGLTDIVGALLESKANPNASLSVYEGSHLMEAISNGNLPIAKMLLQHGGNINTYIHYTNSTPLSIAVSNNKEDAVKFLIENGADVNAPLASNRTVLDQAYYFKRSPNIIKLLVEAGGYARYEKGSAVVVFGNPLKSKSTLYDSYSKPKEAPSLQKNEEIKTSNVAVVNGEYITKANLEALEKEIAERSHGQAFPKEKLIEELIQRELLVQDAIQKQLDKLPELMVQIEDAKKTLITTHKLFDKSPELITRLENAKKTLLTQINVQNFIKANPVTDAEVKAEYDSKVASENETEYKARHILVKTDAEAKKLIAELDNGADFARLANKNSLDAKESQNGGDLGWFVAGQMVVPFSEAVIKLDKGKYTKMPVHTQFGWHVILREDSRTQTAPSFEAAKEQLIPYLQRKKVQNMVERLRKQAKVEILVPLTPSKSKPAVTPEPAKHPDQEVKVKTDNKQTIQAPIVPIHKQGDTYILESISLDSGTRNTTERKVILANSEKLVIESRNSQSKSGKVRKLEFTPEWNLIAVRNSDGSGLNYSPPLKYYEFPLTSGKTWQQTSIETNIKSGAIREHTLSAVVGDWENVTVPAGTFRGVKVTIQAELVDRATGQKTISTDTSWYVPDIRRGVRSLTSTRSPEGVESRQDLQLIKYNLIK